LRNISRKEIALIVYFLGLGIFSCVYSDELAWSLKEFPRYLDSSISAQSSADDLLRLAKRSYFKKKDAETAESQALKGLKIDPYLFGAYELLSRIYYDRQDYSKTESVLKKLNNKDPTNLLAYLRLSSLYRETGREESACLILKEGEKNFQHFIKQYRPAGIPNESNKRKMTKYEKKSLETYKKFQIGLKKIESRLEIVCGPAKPPPGLKADPLPVAERRVGG